MDRNEQGMTVVHSVTVRGSNELNPVTGAEH